ncbi:MAG: hypothetical protein WCF90_10575, partial [Methanomicrobiales archaeon]
MEKPGYFTDGQSAPGDLYSSTARCEPKALKTTLAFPDTTGPFDRLALIFSYDHTLPLDCRETGKKTDAGITVRDISWAGLAQERILAYIVETARTGPEVGIVFGHAGPGDRSTFLDEARELAGSRAACLLVEAKWSDGPRFGRHA